MKCPGQDSQYWNEDAIYEVKCPQCHNLVEFYKDDTTRKCHHCQHRFVNPRMDFGCATYCQFAEQCLGTLPEEFVLQQDSLLKDKVAVEVKRYFRTDFKSIGLATRIAHYAERIARATEGVNVAAILCAAYLLPLRLASKEGDDAGNAAGIVDTLLRNLKADESLIAMVCAIVDDPMLAQTAADRDRSIVSDAYRLALLEGQLKEKPMAESDFLAALASFVCDKSKDEAKNLFQVYSS